MSAADNQPMLESGAGKTLLLIRSHYNGLTKSEQKAAKYIMENAPDIIYNSVTDLAERAEVGETTVLRFCRKLKFNGFQDFKLSLAQDLVKSKDRLNDEATEADDASTLNRRMISSHIESLEQTSELLSSEQLEKAISFVTQASSVHFFGVATSGLTALHASHNFTTIGKRSSAKTDPHFQAIDASLMTSSDVAIGISVSGSTKDTIETLTLAKGAGAKIIVITSNARSPITKLADVVLLMVARESPLQGSSFSAKTSQLFILDILQTGVSLRMKEAATMTRQIAAKAISDKLY